jgi:hypothetical protein
MVVFAAATGLRPSELFGLEWRDVDRHAGIVYVRRAYANGRLRHTKTRLSNRAVPLQAKALEALDRLPPSENQILFPNARGGRIDFRSFGRRHWKPAQRAAGIEPLRGSLRSAAYLRHVRIASRHPRLRRVALHGVEHRDDRPSLRPPRPRQPPARRLAPPHSRSNEPWTLRGRRLVHARSRSAAAIPVRARGVRVGAWTLGGRRASSPSPDQKTKGADKQALPEALWRTRTADPLLTSISAATGRNPRQRFWPDFALFAAVVFATGCQRLRPLGSINAPSSRP